MTDDNKNTPVHTRQKKKNWAVLGMLLGLVALIFIITIIRVEYGPQ